MKKKFPFLLFGLMISTIMSTAAALQSPIPSSPPAPINQDRNTSIVGAENQVYNPYLNSQLNQAREQTINKLNSMLENPANLPKMPTPQIPGTRVPPPPVKNMKQATPVNQYASSPANLKIPYKVNPQQSSLNTPIEIVHPDENKFIDISLTDVNRIVCSEGNIGNVVYSKEKELAITTSGKNIFIKVEPKVEDGRLNYSLIPRELYVECGGRTYSMILVPQKEPTRTIVLESAVGNKKKAKEFETTEPYVQTITRLIKDAFMEKVPYGYGAKVTYKTVKRFQQGLLNLVKIYTGFRYKVEEFTFVPNQQVYLNEALFLPYVGNNVLAISVYPLKASPDQIVRIFVVKEVQ